MPELIAIMRGLLLLSPLMLGDYILFYWCRNLEKRTGVIQPSENRK